MTLRDVLRFYLPLVLTSQMMTLSTPVINLGLGRAHDPAHALASYAVGFTLAVFMNSPALVSNQAASALLRDEAASVRTLLGTFLAVGLLVSAADLLLALTPLGDLVLQSVMGVPHDIAESAKRVLLVMSPIPALLAVRGVYHGVIMTAERTTLITLSTGVRLALLSAVIALLLAGVLGMPGELAGAAALLAGIAGETVIVVVTTRTSLRRHLARHRHLGSEGPADVLRFSLPLFVSAYVWTVQRPLINLILARSAEPKLALAAFGVVAPLVLLTASPLWALQPTTLVLPRTRADLRLLHRFSWAVSGGFSLALLLLAVLAGRPLLAGLHGLDGPLLAMTLAALPLLAGEPPLLALRSFAQGMLLRMKLAGAISRAALLKLVVLLGAGFLAVEGLGLQNGAAVGLGLILLGEAADMAVMFRAARAAVRDGHVAFTPTRPSSRAGGVT